MTRSAESIDLLIGFTAGQIQLMDPVQHECRKCFNDEVTTNQANFIELYPYLDFSF